jgi:BioD-like phosphotransacetylase family protein
MAKKIFIAATQQNDGKTTVSLGLIAALRKHFPRIGFIKPIGQRYLVEQGYKVDEDSVLIEEVFGIKCNIKDMSPVAIERGFTERFIEKGDTGEEYARLITDAYKRIAAENDLVIIEGTGHAGVGSVLNLSNASVAKLLDTGVVMISSGGIGKPIDEVMLNKALLDREGVALAGVVVNKVLPEKFDRIAKLATRGLALKGIDVFGVLPYQKILDIPTMREIRDEIGLDALYEGARIDNPVENVLIGAMNVKDAMQFVTPNSLMIIPGDREDMIDAICKVHSGHLLRKGCPISGIILSGGIMPKSGPLRHLARSRISVLITKEDTYSIASRIHSMVVKLKPQDKAKIKLIVDMVEKSVDIDKILSALR